MKKRIYRAAEALLSTLCAIGFFIGFFGFGLGFTVSLLWSIPIMLIMAVLLFVVIFLEDQIKYEGMTIDERHERLVGNGYRYCPYCGERLAPKEEGNNEQ